MMFIWNLFARILFPVTNFSEYCFPEIHLIEIQQIRFN